MEITDKLKTYFNALKNGYRNPDKYSLSEPIGFEHEQVYVNGFSTGQAVYYWSRAFVIGVLMFLAYVIVSSI